MTTISASIYVDSQDTSDVGWAWRVVIVDENGRRHEESGGCDDEHDGLYQVAAHAAEGEVPTDIAAWACDADGGYRWVGDVRPA